MSDSATTIEAPFTDLEPHVNSTVTVHRKAGRGEPIMGRLAVVNKGVVVLHTEQDGTFNAVGIFTEDIVSVQV